MIVSFPFVCSCHCFNVLSVVKKDNARDAFHQVWSRSRVLPVVFFQVTVCKVKNDFIVFALQANWFALQANWWLFLRKCKNFAIGDHTYLYQVSAKHSGGRLTVRHLNWSLDFKAEEFASPESYDIVVASDVVYDMQVTIVFLPHFKSCFWPIH